MDIKIDAPENQKLQLETLEIKEYEKENQKSQEDSIKPQLETLSVSELSEVAGGWGWSGWW